MHRPADDKCPPSTITVIDWDDTLHINGFGTPELESSACDLIATCVQQGPTYIVTNATRSWVVQCMEHSKWSRIQFILSSMILISAADRYANVTNDIIEWKERAFGDILQAYPLATRFISIGDSIVERAATQRLEQQHPHMQFCTVQLEPNPWDQHNLIRFISDNVTTIGTNGTPNHVNVQASGMTRVCVAQ